jgi:K+/H+ antiporter YhaU regulatory subunit KhtT
VDVEQTELVELEDELAEEIASITDELQARAGRVEEVEIPLEKTDIRVTDLRLLWVPGS